MITPVMKGKVPGSTPSAPQPIPLSRLETMTATPKLPVRIAVTVSRARRDIIDDLDPVAGRAAACGAAPSLDQPALFGRDLLHALEVLLDEGIESFAGQERAHLRGLLDVILPLRRGLHLLHQVDIVTRLIARDL